ncbi:MAG: DUF1273 family protein [Oscillospiraceae bacterium]|nr:DUF1273 family protein [Oscillospiraceae bacterium]
MNPIQELYPDLLPVSTEQTLCFTGHRPDKLPDGTLLAGLLQTLYYYIDSALEQGYVCFLDGMADGIDYLAAEYLFRKRTEYPHIRIIGVQPCRNYEDFFRDRHYSMTHLNFMKAHFDALIRLEGEYLRHSGRKNDMLFAARNHFLVDHSSAIIAVCSLERSGSFQTVSYAKQKKLAVCRIEANPQLFYLPKPEQWPVEKINF